MKMSIDITKRWDGDVFKMTILPKVQYNSLRAAALFCQGQAIMLCPVDQGRLRGSIGMKMKDKSVIKGPVVQENQSEDFIREEPEINVAHVGTNVIYAAAQEFGMPSGYGNYKGPGIPAQPYLRPAADLTEGKALTVCEQAGK